MTPLNQYIKACNDLGKQFARKYFGKNVDQWWISDEVGGVYVINDYFFDMNTIADFIRYKYTRNDMFAYYDYSLKEYEKKEKDRVIINIKNWRQLK